MVGGVSWYLILGSLGANASCFGLVSVAMTFLKTPQRQKQNCYLDGWKGKRNSQIEQLGRFQRQHPMQGRERVSWKR
ncbi:hypothetical protein CFP56_042083 [Quercus suber]|uniref:Uncharacterized protein n=1 Tax=Quercus suber TaxID=58331 RepID=A0AAW0M8R6_QUESU